ncbi:hypothetical protein [Komagataeibacter europaeus]|uniref:hypothetical protein n=1 Tax=Komagataeibacter europaeus TaxID=33995 RepID=UPI00128EADBC|nr:hypothetical protein [Komagataeibacter europaeus]
MGEIDPRKIMDLPADILMHWQAFINIQNEPLPDAPERDTSPPVGNKPMTEEELFEANVRIIGYG